MKYWPLPRGTIGDRCRLGTSGTTWAHSLDQVLSKAAVSLREGNSAVENGELWPNEVSKWTDNCSDEKEEFERSTLM